MKVDRMSLPPRKLVKTTPLKGFRLIIPGKRSLNDLINMGIERAGILIRTAQTVKTKLPFPDEEPKPQAFHTGYFKIGRRSNYNIVCESLATELVLEDVKKDLENNGFSADIAVREFRHFEQGHSFRWKRYTTGFTLLELDGKPPEQITREELELLHSSIPLLEKNSIICGLCRRLVSETVCEIY